MKTFVCALMALLAIIFDVSGRTVNVKGYYRKDGTYVRPHVRHTKGSSYSTIDIPAVGEISAPIRYERTYTLDTCKAIYDNGRRCSRYVECGEKYCSEHKEYNPDAKPRYLEKCLPKTDLERSSSTREKLESIRKAIDYYSDGRAGSLPDSLANLRALNPTFMTPPTVDAWERPFSYELNNDWLYVRSAGPDAEFGTEDDLVLQMEL